MHCFTFGCKCFAVISFQVFRGNFIFKTVGLNAYRRYQTLTRRLLLRVRLQSRQTATRCERTPSFRLHSSRRPHQPVSLTQTRFFPGTPDLDTSPQLRLAKDTPSSSTLVGPLSLSSRLDPEFFREHAAGPPSISIYVDARSHLPDRPCHPAGTTRSPPVSLPSPPGVSVRFRPAPPG